MTPSLPGRRRHPSVAFTLVELLMALVVSGILVAALTAAARHLLQAWQETAGRLEQGRRAEQILDTLARDLEALCFRRDGGVWFAATLQRSPQPPRGEAGLVDAEWSGRVKPPDGVESDAGSSLALNPADEDAMDTRFGQAGLWIRFFTVQPDSNDSLVNHSAPRAVGYQLVRRRVTASASSSGGAQSPLRYVLYRATARPFGPGWPETNSTFASGYDLFRADATPDYNVADASRIDQVGNLRAPRRYEQILAQNVIDLGVRVWTRDERGGLRPVFPDRDAGGRDVRGFAATVQDGRWRSPAAVPPGWMEEGGTRDALARGIPERIDVWVRLLTEEGARVIEAFERGRTQVPAGSNEAETWWSLARRHSSVFCRPVFMHGQALE